jgi:hypothetical protein
LFFARVHCVCDRALTFLLDEYLIEELSRVLFRMLDIIWI